MEYPLPEDFPLHLLLPLTASVVFVFGLMLVKRASDQGANQWTVTFFANMLAWLLFSNYLWLGDWTPAESSESTSFALTQFTALAWQPATIAVLFILGQVFTFSAISLGDVSLATPVFSVKVVLVAILVTVVAGEHLTWVVWVCAFMATAGIVLVQFGDKRKKGGSVGLTIALALLAACSFATHDLLVQRWSPAWPTALFLPTMFTVVAVLSLGILPFMGNPFRLKRSALLFLIAGAFCIAVQAICIVSSLSLFGDAARVNIVYALRGLWGVLLAFLLARQFKSHEAEVTRRVMTMRIIGAALLTVAVMLAIVH